MASGILARGLPFLAPHLVVFELLIGSAALGFTPSSRKSFARPLTLALLSGCALGAIGLSRQFLRPQWAALVGGVGLILLLQYIDLALVGSWCYDTHGPLRQTWNPRLLLPPRSRTGRCTPTKRWEFERDARPSVSPARSADASDDSSWGEAPKWSFWNRMRFGLDSMCSLRHPNTKHEVRNVPRFSDSDPFWVPSRWEFVRNEVLRVILCVLLLDITARCSHGPVSAGVPSRSLESVRARSEGVLEHLEVRLFALGSLATTFWCTVQGLQSLAGALVVGSGCSEPKFWRPPFGNPVEAYSLKNLWGKVMPQHLRRISTGLATCISCEAFHLPHWAESTRLAVLFISFVVSGLVQSCAGVAAGSCVMGALAAVRFSCAQAVGVAMEDAAREICKRLGSSANSNNNNYSSKNSSGSDDDKPSVLVRMLGFVWTIGWVVVWAPAFWVWPAGLLPFSIFAP